MLGIRGVVIGLQAIIALIVLHQGRGNIRGWLVQALVALLGQTGLTSSGILPNLCPERLIGSPDLAGDVGCHLGRQLIGSPCLVVGFLTQAYLVAHLAMRESIPTHSVERITISQLRCAQGLELCRIGMQFELGRDELFHRTCVQCFREIVNVEYL
jgi:hypothetical protein